MKINLLPPMTNMAQQTSQVKAQQDAESFAQILQEASKQQDDKALMNACQQFESYFMHQMLKGMRATIPESDLVEKSFGRGIYQDMLDEQYGKEMAQAGGIGLAKILYQDLTRNK